MSADLLDRAVSDLREGWYEAAVDALGRAIRDSEAARWKAVEQRLAALEARGARAFSELASVVADVDARLVALEQRGRLSPKLAELNEFRRSEARRLDDEIRAILAFPGWPSAKEVRKALQSAAFNPLPSERALREHLRRIRGKRQHTVMSHSEASPPQAPAILSDMPSGGT